MEKTLSHLAIQGWYNIDSAIVFNLLSAANKRRNTCRAHISRVQQCQEEPFVQHVSQKVNLLGETPVCGECRRIRLTSLRDASVDFRIPNFGQLCHTQIEDDWGHDVAGLVLGYDQNIVINIISIKLHNGLLYYCQPFHCPKSVERLGLDCKGEYNNVNQGIMPESHNIVTATRDCGRVTAILYSRLATRLRSLAIILPIHLYLLSLESTFASVYHNYHTYAYKAQRWRTCPYTIIAVQ